jgi:predicted MFS family arabinose efflux permease
MAACNILRAALPYAPMPNDNPAAPRLVSRALFLYFVSAFGSMTSFYLLLSVVPLFATTAGAGRTGAGLTTGALMLATVGAELATPALLARFGYRAVLSAGLVLLGAPLLALTESADFVTILAVCLVRGIGLAILVVAGSALVATLVPAERRSEGLGLLGVVVGVPAVLALPLGVWLAERVGFVPVFVAGAVASLACLTVMPAMPGLEARAGKTVGILEGLRTPAQTRPALMFLLTAMGTGIVVTFLPLAMRNSARLAALVLLANTIATTTARWWAGRYGSRHRQASLLVGGVVTAALGMLALALTGSPVAVGVGAVLLGMGFGVAQNSSLALMFERASVSGYDMVSAVWNLAYDAGLGLGAAGFGVVVVRAGYSGAFVIAAAGMLVALAPVWLQRGWLR